MVTHTFDADAETLEYVMPTGGVYTFDAVRVTGDATLTLQTKLSEAGTYVDYYNDSGVKQEVSASSSRPHVRFEALGRKGQYFQVISSATASTPSYPASAGHAAFLQKAYGE